MKYTPTPTPIHSIPSGSWIYKMSRISAYISKCLPTMWETRVQSLGWEDLLEKEMATHSSILAWKIPWMEEPGRLQVAKSRVWLNDFTSLHCILQCCKVTLDARSSALWLCYPLSKQYVPAFCFWPSTWGCIELSKSTVCVILILWLLPALGFCLLPLLFTLRFLLPS